MATILSIIFKADNIFTPANGSWRFCNQCSLWFVCQQDYCKSNQQISLELGVTIGPINQKNRLSVVILSWIRIVDHFSTSFITGNRALQQIY